MLVSNQLAVASCQKKRKSVVQTLITALHFPKQGLNNAVMLFLEARVIEVMC